MRFLTIVSVAIVSLFAVASSASAQPATEETSVSPQLKTGDFGCTNDDDCPQNNSCVPYRGVTQCLGNYDASCHALRGGGDTCNFGLTCRSVFIGDLGQLLCRP